MNQRRPNPLAARAPRRWGCRQGKSWDAVARPYRWLERLCFGSALQRARTVHLGRLAGCRRILVLGEGDGRFLEQLWRQWPFAHDQSVQIHVIDRSTRMLDLARRRVSSVAVTFSSGDARSHPLNGPYDAVVTAFFLDCFEDADLSHLLDRVAAHCTPTCVWLYADFHGGDTRWARLRNGAWLWALYIAFGALTDIAARRLVDPLPQLRQLGWEPVAVAWYRARLLRSVYLQRTPARRARVGSPLPAGSSTCRG